jgi:hypothetical protein
MALVPNVAYKREPLVSALLYSRRVGFSKSGAL